MNELLIVGTGALATLYAVRLTAAGIPVIMLGTWKSGLEALQRNGARLVDATGFEIKTRVTATNDPRVCRGTKHALVLVKAWQTERAAHQLAECLESDGLVLTLQNGLGNREILSRVLNKPDLPERVVLGVTTTGATLLGPGLVRTGGDGQISIEKHASITPIEKALRSAGFKVELVENVQALVWGKLVINAAINPLTAILRVPNGVLMKRPAAHELMTEAAREAAFVGVAEGAMLPFNDPVTAVETVAEKTAANHSSMLQDINRGAPTEIDAISGEVAQRGERWGIPTPVTRTFWKLVKAMADEPENVRLHEMAGAD